MKHPFEGPRVYKPAPESNIFTAGHCPEHENPMHDQTTWNMPRVYTLLGLAVFWCAVAALIIWFAC